MRKILLFLLVLIASPLLAKDVYKVTSESGEVTYSDTYLPGAERMRVSGSTSAPSKLKDSEDELAAGTIAEGAIYESFAIVQPENEQTIRNDEGNVNVSLMLTPGLAEGHSLRVLLDGTRIEGEMRSTQFALKGLSRGSHSLKISVVDEAGTAQAESKAINFHLRKAAIANP